MNIMISTLNYIYDLKELSIYLLGYLKTNIYSAIIWIASSPTAINLLLSITVLVVGVYSIRSYRRYQQSKAGKAQKSQEQLKELTQLRTALNEARLNIKNLGEENTNQLNSINTLTKQTRELTENNTLKTVELNKQTKANSQLNQAVTYFYKLTDILQKQSPSTEGLTLKIAENLHPEPVDHFLLKINLGDVINYTDMKKLFSTLVLIPPGLGNNSYKIENLRLQKENGRTEINQFFYSEKKSPFFTIDIDETPQFKKTLTAFLKQQPGYSSTSSGKFDIDIVGKQGKICSLSTMIEQNNQLLDSPLLQLNGFDIEKDSNENTAYHRVIRFESHLDYSRELLSNFHILPENYITGLQLQAAMTAFNKCVDKDLSVEKIDSVQPISFQYPILANPEPGSFTKKISIKNEALMLKDLAKRIGTLLSQCVEECIPGSDAFKAKMLCWTFSETFCPEYSHLKSEEIPLTNLLRNEANKEPLRKQIEQHPMVYLLNNLGKDLSKKEPESSNESFQNGMSL